MCDSYSRTASHEPMISLVAALKTGWTEGRNTHTHAYTHKDTHKQEETCPGQIKCNEDHWRAVHVSAFDKWAYRERGPRWRRKRRACIEDYSKRIQSLPARFGLQPHTVQKLPGLDFEGGDFLLNLILQPKYSNTCQWYKPRIHTKIKELRKTSCPWRSLGAFCTQGYLWAPADMMASLV